MKHGAVVEFVARQKDEIVHRFGSALGEKLAHDFPARSVETQAEYFFAGSIVIGGGSRIFSWHAEAS